MLRRGEVWMILIIGSLVFLNYFSGTNYNYPPIWPDEALFSDTALNLLDGEMATTCLTGIIPGMEHHTYWMPPVYFIFLASVFKIFGFGILQARLLSLAAGFLVLFMTYLLAKKVGGTDRHFAVVATALVAVNVVFFRASNIARMDMLTLAFILVGFYFFLSYMETLSRNTYSSNLSRLILSGGSIGLAGLTHPMGIIGFLAIFLYVLLFVKTKDKLKILIYFTLSCGIVFSLWLIYIAEDPGLFIEQFGGQFVRKNTTQSLSIGVRLWNAVTENAIQYGLNQTYLVISFWVASLFFSAKVLFQKTKGKTGDGNLFIKLPALALIVSTVLIIMAREMWYPLYMVPFITIIVFYFIKVLKNKKLKLFANLVLICFIFAVGSNTLISTWKSFNSQRDIHSFTYKELGAKVEEILPEKSKVMLMVIPDLYFYLSESNKDFELFEYAPGGIPVDSSKYRERLREMDYIVYGRAGYSIVPFTGDLVIEFIDEETERIFHIKDEEKGFFVGVLKVNKLANQF